MNLLSKDKRTVIMVLATFAPIATWIGCTEYTGTIVDPLIAAFGGLSQTYVSVWLTLHLK